MNNRFRLDANGVEIYGNGVSKASYINWIVDYNQQLGIDSTTVLTEDLAALAVRLCYRFGAFTAKNLLQVYTEKSSPQSINSGLLLPDESYNLFLYKNVPIGRATYSSVIVQKTQNGYAIYGYGTVDPYFETLASINAGPSVEISADKATLVFDVEGDTQEGVSVRSEAVPFATTTGRVDVNADLGEWRIVEAPTVLTPEGAAAFGTYPAGESLDPVTIEVAVEPGCFTSSGLFAQPLAWVVSGTLLAGALAGALTVWARKSRGPERPTPQVS